MTQARKHSSGVVTMPENFLVGFVIISQSVRTWLTVHTTRPLVSCTHLSMRFYGYLLHIKDIIGNTYVNIKNSA